MFWYLRIFTVLNHCNKISPVKVCFSIFVETAHKFQSLLNQFSDPKIWISQFVTDLLNGFLEDKIIMRIDIETLWIDIDCFDEAFFVFWFLRDFLWFLVVNNSAAFRKISKFIFIVKQSFDHFVKTVFLSKENSFQFFFREKPFAKLFVIGVSQFDQKLKLGDFLHVNVSLLDWWEPHFF